MQPINYGVEIQDPTQSFLSAFQTGAAIQDTRLKQEQQQQQMANQKLIQEGFNKLRQPGATAADYANLAMVLPETQAKAVRESFNMLSGERQQNALQQSGQVFSAFKAGKPEIAIGLLERQIEAKRNSGDNEGAMFLETWRDVAKENPKATEDYFGFTISQMPGGDKVIESAVKFGGERRAEAQAPAELRQKLADADKAEAEAKVKMETAKDEIAKTKATREYEQAKAKKEQIQADTELQTRLSDIGFKQAQINKFKVETRNLDTQGKMLSLDFQAALQGLPLPSKKTEGGGGTATEDERKAAGWLAQATNAYNNMLGAMYTKEGKKTGAEAPGKLESALGILPFIGEGSAALARSTDPDRQKFTQAASSLSEALLRAATGAGVNRDEAKQKLEELTPLFTDGDDTRKQKLAAIPMYLESLKSRAGRAAPGSYQVPQVPKNPFAITLPDGQEFIAPNQKALDEFKRRAGL
jgi:hypothetical protein